jgi:signal transduction histidine kinase
MNSLGTRLFAAFLAVILVVVLIVSFALIVLLRDSPIVDRQGLAELYAIAQSIPPRELLRADLSPAAAEAAAQRLAAIHGTRVLLATAAGEVVADSAGDDAAALRFFRFRAARREASFPDALVGRARDARGRAWLYVARPAGAERVAVFAAPSEPLPVLTFFRENLFRPLWQAAAAAVLIAGVLAVLIARWIARPLQTMALRAQGLAQGRYDTPAPVTGPDEVRALGTAFNRMTRQVQAAQQGQRDFLANVSHELRTPLTSIQGFAQAMLDGAVTTPEGVARSAGIIHTEAERMRRLVESLLDLARLDADLRALRRAPVDLRALLAGLVESLSLRATQQGVTLRAELPASLPALAGDADRLRQLFSNLLDNALKHTPAGGQVMLAAAPAAGAVEVTVADTGAGLPPEELGRIFERFYQVDKSRAGAGGAGLGLAIAREIAEAHGGSLRAESAPGAGARFVVRLPGGG